MGDAIGTAAEGGLFARAVSRKEGGKEIAGAPLERGHFAENSCLNCGTELQGQHCHQCGQKAHLHRTIGAFLHDLVHGALHFDGKTWRTLPKLALKPGELTRRYIEGERARFVSPMALFLFSIFLMFAVFQFAGITTPTDFENPIEDSVGDALAAEIKSVDEQLAELNAQIEDAPDDDPVAELVAARDQMQIRRDELARINDFPVLGEMVEEAATREPGSGRVIEEDDGSTTILRRDGAEDVKMNVAALGWFEGLAEKWRTNPGLMLYKLQTNFYKFSWLLIPLSLPFVSLIFLWKRRFKAYDHAVFVTYSLSFMSILFIVLSVLSMIGMGGGWLFILLAIIPPVHLYKHLKGTYGLSRFSTLWRLALLLIFIIIVLVLFLQVLIAIGAF